MKNIKGYSDFLNESKNVKGENLSMIQSIVTNKKAQKEVIDYIDQKISDGYTLDKMVFNSKGVYLNGGQQNLSFHLDKNGLDGEIRMSNPAGYTSYKSFSDELKGIESWYQGQKGSL